MTQHAGLSEERWARFDLDSQVLMIANEMHRATRLLGDALHVADQPDPAAHADALRALLRLWPLASKQIPLLLPD